jgi:hypothetical protein
VNFLKKKKPGPIIPELQTCIFPFLVKNEIPSYNLLQGLSLTSFSPARAAFLLSNGYHPLPSHGSSRAAASTFE